MKTISRVSSGVNAFRGKGRSRRIRNVESGQVAVLAVEAAAEFRKLDVESFDVLVGVGGIDFDNQRFCGTSAWAHRLALELDAFAADRLDELDEGGRPDHRDVFSHIAAEVHAAKAAAQRLLGQDAGGGVVGAQPHDGGHVAHVPSLLEHQHRNDRLVGTLPSVDGVGGLAQHLQFLLRLAARGFRNVAVLLRVDHQHRTLQLGSRLLEPGADLVAVARVVHHDEQHRFLSELRVLRGSLAPFLDAEPEVVRVSLGENGALLLVQPGEAGGVGQRGVLHHVLVDRLDERIVGNSLDEDRAVVVLGRCRDIHLQREGEVLLQHAVVDVLDRLEPRHPLVVDVVCLVIEDGQLVDIAHDLAQVRAAVGGLADGLRAEGRQEVVSQVVVLRRRRAQVPEVDAVDVGEEEVAERPERPDLVLQVQGDLEVVAPVAALVAVVGQHRVVEEDPKSVKISTQAVEHDDVRRDQQDVAREP